MSEENKAPEQAPAQTAQTPAPEEKIELTPAQLSERMARHTRSQFKAAFGTDSAEEVNARLKQLSTFEAAEEERRKAQMTEIERAKLEAQQAKTEAAQLREQLDAREFESRVSQTCAKLGIKNVDYAMYSIIQATEKLEGDNNLDAEEFLSAQIASQGAAFGVTQAPTVVTTPANTSPAGQAPAAPAAGQQPPNNDAFALKDTEWQARKAQLGLR